MMPILQKQRLIKHGLLLMSIVPIYSCASSEKKEFQRKMDATQIYTLESDDALVIRPKTINDDVDYFPVLKKRERDVNLYHDLELAFSGSAVLMTSDMQEAYKKRYQDIQGGINKLDSNIVPENSDILPVVVTCYTPADKYSEFEDKKIWTMALKYNHKIFMPISLVRYRNKSSLSSFFPEGSYWSKMYVVQFHIPHRATNLENQVVFSMHSGIAKADYFWR